MNDNSMNNNAKTSVFHFLILQIVGAISAVLIFKFVPLKFVAALLAGSVFTIIGFIIFYRSLKSKDLIGAPIFWASAVFLFIFSLPMLLIRAVNYDVVNFKEFSLMGLNMGTYHRLSEGFYLLFIAITIFEIYRAKKNLV